MHNFKCVNYSVQSHSSDLMDCTPPGSSVKNSPGRNTELVAISGDLPDSGIKPGSPELQTDSLLSEL